MGEDGGEARSLAQVIADRLRAGALVLVVQEADEALALAACAAGAGGCAPVRVLPGSSPDVSQEIDSHKTGAGTLVVSDLLAIYGSNAIAVRLVREVALQSRPEGESYSRLILVERPSTPIPPALAGDVEVVAPPLPSVEDLASELDSFISSQGIQLTGNGETRYAIASAVAGLPRHEAARLYARSVVERGGLEVAFLRTEKARRVAQRLGGALTFESTDGAEVGGLAGLRAWLASRRGAFGSQKARAFGLPEPKGILLLGVPGGGKSLTARAVAREWGLPLLRLDAGRLFGSLVGASEANTRAAVEAAEASAPCVLWVDEIEKGLAGGGSGSSTDSGTTQRVFGALLTWLQEKKSPVFVVATANRISALPPELLRKGRFDEIFYVGLPSREEREEIARIHLKRKGRDLPAAPIAEASDGFTGAEIEQAVIEGLFQAYAGGRELSVADVLAAIQATTPLSRTMAAEIQATEQWAKGRARMASGSAEVPAVAPRRRGPAIAK